MTMQENLRHRLVHLTERLVAIPGTERRRPELSLCLDLIVDELGSLPSIQLSRHVCNGHESLLALPQGIDRPEVLLCGHVDVIDHAQDEVYQTHVVNGRIIGPGAGDMKGQDAIMIELFRRLHQQFPGLSLGLALTSDEEIGGFDGTRFLCEDLGFRCGVVIVPDGGSLCDITVEEKGVLHLKISLQGRGAHGARPWLGENAVEMLIDNLTQLKQHFQQFWPQEEIREQRNHWFPTCSLTSLHTPNQSPNRIPSLAEALLDIRFPPPACVDSMLDKVQSLVSPACELQPLMTAEPTQLNPDPLFCQITAELTNSSVQEVRASGSSDSRFFRQFDIPVNLSRPLVGNLHAIDEWIDINSMVTYYQICERYITQKLQVT